MVKARWWKSNHIAKPIGWMKMKSWQKLPKKSGACTTDGRHQRRRICRAPVSDFGNTRRCARQGGVSKTKTVPILPKDESCACSVESRVLAGFVGNIQQVEALRHSGMENEHGQTLIATLQEIFAPRLWELTRHVDADRVR